MNKPKVILWDIEATNLNANFGYILCISWKEHGKGKKVITKAISDYPLFKKEPTNDRALVEDVAKQIGDADMFVFHYGSRYDFPFLNSRLIFHGLKPLPKIPFVDTWRVSRYNLKLNSNRLDAISQFLCTGTRKTPVNGATWIKAMSGDAGAIKYIIKHCEADVKVLEEVYDKIKSVYPQHPNLNIVREEKQGCPVCGSKSLTKRGYQITKTTKKQRFQCGSCGAWSHGRSLKSVEMLRND